MLDYQNIEVLTKIKFTGFTNTYVEMLTYVNNWQAWVQFDGGQGEGCMAPISFSPLGEYCVLSTNLLSFFSICAYFVLSVSKFMNCPPFSVTKLFPFWYLVKFIGTEWRAIWMYGSHRKLKILSQSWEIYTWHKSVNKWMLTHH